MVDVSTLSIVVAAISVVVGATARESERTKQARCELFFFHLQETQRKIV
jgi:hypothetical protein